MGGKEQARGFVAVHYCPGCGSAVPEAMRADAVYCSAACRAKHWRWAQRSRLRVRVIRAPGSAQARCPECGTVWVAGLERRVDAVYCSPRCRTRGWRRHHKGYSVRPIRHRDGYPERVLSNSNRML